ncbi:hypothetical protein QUA42_10365 [Microcoleus sp. Pol11C2]|uniref:hypothetical protein n=1 Tax=Microcoleus sp. Pol11C2 TaxID=3055389 RepID=UPI002FD10EB3
MLHHDQQACFGRPLLPNPYSPQENSFFVERAGERVLDNGATYKSKWRWLLNPKARIDAPNMIQDFVLSYSPDSAASTVTIGYYLFLPSNQAST